jgi:hypothetical protein
VSPLLGFSLVAPPGGHEKAGVKTFIVSHAGVVREKDLGAKVLQRFRAMERSDPGESYSHHIGWRL